MSGTRKMVQPLSEGGGPAGFGIKFGFELGTASRLEFGFKPYKVHNWSLGFVKHLD